MPGFFMFNGKYFPISTAVIGPDNRAFRYGDGIFETLRVAWGKIPLANYHFNRCFKGMKFMGFEIPVLFTPENLEKNILELCKKNNHLESARVRINFFRGDGGLYDPESHRLNYIIQTWSLPEHYKEINQNGLALTTYTLGRKSRDQLSNLKSNSALIYILAAKFAKDHKCNEALVLNDAHNIADTTIANIFWIKEGEIFTNPLSEGIVAGVMRQFIINSLLQKGITVGERPVNPEQILTADEIFTTNALYGIRWVASFGEKNFGMEKTSRLYHDIINPLFID
jgi:branched-chain amino acid aminotransferase